MTDDQSTLRVELRVRETTTTSEDERQRGVYERLARLRDAGKIAEMSVEHWGQRVHTRAAGAPDDGPIHDADRATYEAFETWAERTGHDLEPAFSAHRHGSLIGDERAEVIRVPVVCLAVYDDDDELRGVAPCTTDAGVRTVDDCLAALQSGDESAVSVEACG